MSTYACFAIKGRDGKYLPLGDYSRSSVVYRFFSDYLPFEDKVPITNEMIAKIRDAIDEQEGNYYIEKNQHNEKIEIYRGIIAAATSDNVRNIMEEVMEYISAEIECLQDIESEIEELDKARRFCDMISYLIKEVAWFKKFNVDEYIFGGIEYNFFPTEDDE